MVAKRLVGVLWAAAFAMLPPDPGHAAPASPTFEAGPCPFTADARVLEQLRCGYVAVPENRALPDGRRLKLAVTILKSVSATPRPDPVVFVAGGPGNAVVIRVPGIVRDGTLDALRADRDVILYDQRGIGFSEPAFCPELKETTGTFDGPAARRAHQRQVLARCGDSMRRAGYDLSQYNSIVSAHDLQDLRRALGYQQWNVYGASYGTRLALVAMRVAPQGIRTAVLDGPSPPNRAVWFNRPADFAEVLGRLSAACAAKPECNAAFPEVEQTFWQTVDALEREPFTLEVTTPNGTTRTATLTGATYVARVRVTLERLHAAVPLLVHGIRAKNVAVLNGVNRAIARSGVESPGLNLALGATVNCFEEAPLNTVELLQRTRRATAAVLTDGGIFNDPRLCDGLHAFRATPEQTALVESAIPALIFTGEFDMQTPRSSGEPVARALKGSQLVEFPGVGHVPSWRYDCPRTMMRAFYNAPTQKVDVSCLKSMPPLQFITDVKALVK